MACATLQTSLLLLLLLTFSVTLTFANIIGGGLAFEGDDETFNLIHEMAGDGGWV